MQVVVEAATVAEVGSTFSHFQTLLAGLPSEMIERNGVNFLFLVWFTESTSTSFFGANEENSTQSLDFDGGIGSLHSEDIIFLFGFIEFIQVAVAFKFF